MESYTSCRFRYVMAWDASPASGFVPDHVDRPKVADGIRLARTSI